MSAGQPVENVELSDEIDDVKSEIASIVDRLAEREDEMDRMFLSDDFNHVDAGAIKVDIMELEAERDLLQDRRDALERRFAAEQEALSRRRSADVAERLRGEARRHVDATAPAQASLVDHLRCAAEDVRTITEAGHELANLRVRLESVNAEAGLGLDPRAETRTDRLSREQVRFARSALVVIVALLDRHPIPTSAWADLEARRKKIE